MSDEHNLNELTEETGKESKKKKRKKKLIDECLETLLYLGIAFLVAYFLTTYVGQRTVVDGSSMEKTLSHGDNLIMDKISYKIGKIKRYDVVVFPHNDPVRGEVNYIKRIIGLPGEIVTITDGKIYITDENGKRILEEKYGYYENDVPMLGYNAEESIVLGDNEYFVLGDNRNNSTDSRVIGAVKKEDIVGKVIFRIYPFSKIGTVS